MMPASSPQPAARGSIFMENLGLQFGRGSRTVRTLQSIDLNIKPGEFVCVIGPSGCGKSTLLGAVAGFIPVSEGRLLVDREKVMGPGADRGMVFQHHTLFPWKTIASNVEFGLKMRGMPQAQRREAGREFIKKVGLAGFERHYPAQLSGGMQQRVGLARVLINQPRVLLMDEPFGALDAQTRIMMQELLLEIWNEIRTTVIFVTHDIDEAIFLADRIVVMTCRPATVKAQIDIKIRRPRTLDDVTTPEFSRIKRDCMALVREESLRAINGPKLGRGDLLDAALESGAKMGLA